MAGGVYFHDKASTARVAGVEPTGLTVFSPYDGLARKDRVRYDTPTFAGFMLSGSVASEDNYTPNNGVIKPNKYASDIALRYENRICDVKLLAAISHYRFSKWGEDRNRKVNDASIAALHVPTGLNIALNYATSKFGTDTLAAVPVPAPAPVGTLSQGIDKTQKFQRAQLGLISELNCYGPTNFVVDYAQSKHAFENDAKGKGYGIGVVQQLKKINSEAYVAVRQMKFDRPLVDIHYNKMLAAMVGLRINFGGKLL
jgi:predicted porin